MKSPKISVCIPVYNAELWLAESIESVMDQSFKDWEIVIIDDRSTDSTPRLLEYYANKYRDRIKGDINDRNMGIAYSRNRANTLAAGEVIVVQDSDDISHKDRLKTTWKYFKRHKGIDLVYGSYQYIDYFGKPKGQENAKPFDADELKKHNYIAHPTVAYRRDIGVKYRSECRVLDDWFFYLDCIKAGKKFAAIKEVLSFYRVLPTSVSRSEEKQKQIEKMREKFHAEANTGPLGV